MKAILLVFLLFIANFSIAGNVGYEVEVIIFEDTSELYKNSEIWSLNTDASDLISQTGIQPETTVTKNIIENSVGDSNKEMIFEFINEEHFRLNKQAAKLHQHANYNILYHKAWKQPGLDKASAKAIPINTKNIINTDQTIESGSFLIGDFTLIMSRYLHVVSNLTLYKKIETFLDASTTNYENNETINIKLQPINTHPVDTFTQYPLVFERRMRSKEIHYIDHPMGGMIVLAIPYKIGRDEPTKTKEYKTL